jgi:hydrogenase maturation protease
MLLVLGLGNAYCGDDVIGLIVARELHRELGQALEADLLELTASSFDVAERMAGYDRVILIDALVDEEAPVGTVRRGEIEDCRGENRLGMHAAGLADALQLARLAGLSVPPRITVYGIVIRQPFEFSEQLSPELQAGLPDIIRRISASESGTRPGPGPAA